MNRCTWLQRWVAAFAMFAGFFGWGAVSEQLAAERIALEARLATLAPGEQAAELVDLAIRFHAQAHLQLAVDLYDSALEREEVARARYLRAMARRELGDMTAAIADFQMLFDTAALDEGLRGLVGLRLGSAYFSVGQFDEARARLIDALLLSRDKAAILVLLADIAAENDEWRRARGLLERALAEQPRAGRIARKLARVLAELGADPDGRRRLEAQNDVGAAISDPWLSELVDQSRSPAVFLDLAQQSWQRGDSEEAVAAYRRAAQLAPDDAEIRLSLAVALATINEVAMARRALDVAMKLDAKDARSWYLLARLEARAGAIDGVLDAATYSLSLESTDRTRALRANLLMMLARFADAVAEYEVLSATRQDDAGLLYWLALARLGAGACEAALGPIARAVELQPNWGEARIVAIRGVAMCGGPALRREALVAARRLASIDQSVVIRITLGFIEWALGERVVAERLLEGIEHPDARLLLTAIERDELPGVPFAAGSSFWIPVDVRARDGESDKTATVGEP